MEQVKDGLGGFLVLKEDLVEERLVVTVMVAVVGAVTVVDRLKLENMAVAVAVPLIQEQTKLILQGRMPGMEK